MMGHVEFGMLETPTLVQGYMSQGLQIQQLVSILLSMFA